MTPIKLLHILRKMDCEAKPRKELPPFILHHKISRAILLLELLKYDVPVRTKEIPIESRMIVDYRFTKRWEDAGDFVTQTAHARGNNVFQTFYTYILTDRGRDEAMQIEANLQRMINQQIERKKSA
jgi:hypothetical protein